MAESTSSKMEIIQDIMAQISTDKDKYGMEDVNFENLYLGAEIPVYNYVDEVYTRVDQIEYRPILEGNTCIAIAYCTIGGGGENLISIGKSFAGTLNNVEPFTPLAILISGNETSVYHSSDITFSTKRECTNILEEKEKILQKNAIDAGSPIFAGATDVTNTVGHAVVLRGYSEGSTTKLFSYMNPTGGSYWSANMSVDGQFLYRHFYAI